MSRLLLLSTAALALTACAEAVPESPRIGTPNPASTYCVEQGGRLEIRKTEGGETGYCRLPDGRVVEEWEFFRANHPA